MEELKEGKMEEVDLDGGIVGLREKMKGVDENGSKKKDEG